MSNTNTQAFSYVMQELTQVSPLPVDSYDHFLIQMRSDTGNKTKWLNITPTQFRAIEKVLLGLE